MLESFPSLLIATEFPPNASGGGPAVLRQMLRNWPVDRLFWWSCFPEQEARFGQRVAAHRVATITRRFYPNRKFTRVKSWLLDRCWVPSATRHFRKTLADFRPQAVWVVPHNWAIPPLVAVLPQAGTCFHLTLQDYPEMNSSIATFGRKRCRQWAQAVDKLYSAATTRDATSHPMIEDLKSRTGRDAAQMMHAGLEPEDFRFLDSGAGRPGSQIRIAYAGTIHAEPEFAFFVTALKDIASALPAPVRISLFGAHSYQSRPWFDPSWMQEHGNLPEEPLLEALRECTWGFSPMALSDDDPRYNRFSFPTKFITYLAAGLPVITLGHPQNSVVKMASTYPVGLCSTTTSRTELAQQLLTALSQPAPARIYAPGIRRCASAEFDAPQKRALLYQCLQRCSIETLGRAGKDLETTATP